MANTTVRLGLDDGSSLPITIEGLPDGPISGYSTEVKGKLKKLMESKGASTISLAPQGASGAPQGSSAQPVIPEDDPVEYTPGKVIPEDQGPTMGGGEKAARIGGGLAAEITVGMGAQALGLGLGLAVGGPFAPITGLIGYGIGSFAGGFGGSMIAQAIEGEDFSLGRAVSSGGLNTIPGGAALKVGTKIGTKLAPNAMKLATKKSAIKGVTPSKKMLSKLGQQAEDGVFIKGNRVVDEAARGALYGGLETQATELIDKGRPASLPDTLMGIGFGAGTGAILSGAFKGLGALMRRRAKSGNAPKDETDAQALDRAAFEDQEAYEYQKVIFGEEAKAIDKLRTAKEDVIGKLQNSPITPESDMFLLKGQKEAAEFEANYSASKKIVEDETISSLASYDYKTKTTRLNSKAIEKDWDEGMPYLQGKGEGIHATTSEQKAEVMKDIDIDALREKLGSWEGYRKFIAAHEYAHEVLGVADMPKKDGKIIHMDEKAIQLEREANEHAAKTLGIDWGSLRKEKDTLNVYWGGENASKPTNAPERILSNLAKRKFTWEGKEYGSVEHAYQSNKSGTFDLSTYNKYNKIGGHGSKIRGKGTVAEMKAADSLGLMKRLVVESFKQNPNSEAAKTLMQYGNFTHNTNQLIDQAFLDGLKLSQQELKPKPTSKPKEEEIFASQFEDSKTKDVELSEDAKQEIQNQTRISTLTEGNKRISQIDKNIKDANDLKGWEQTIKSVIRFSNSLLAPSHAIGESSTRAIELLKNTVSSYVTASNKALNRIQAFADTIDTPFNHSGYTIEQFDKAMDNFIKGKLGEVPDVLKSIEGDLMAVRDLISQAQAHIVKIADPSLPWAPRIDPDVAEQIQRSNELQNWSHTTYDIFSDKDWRSDAVKRDMALQERQRAVFRQQIKLEESLMSGGIAPKEVEARFKQPENRALKTDYSNEKGRNFEAQQAAVSQELDDLVKIKTDSKEWKIAYENVKKRELDIKKNSARNELTQAELDRMWKWSGEYADKSFQELESMSPWFQRKRKGKESARPKILTPKRDVPYWQSQWMGKQEKAATILHRSVAAAANLEASMEFDRHIIDLMMKESQNPQSIFGKIFIGGDQARGSGYELLRTRTGFSTKEVYVEKWVNDAMEDLLSNNRIINVDNPMLNVPIDVVTSLTSLWKSTKTLMSVPTAVANLVSAGVSGAMHGVLLTPSGIKNFGKGVSRGLHEFNWIDQWTADMNRMHPEKRVDAINEVKKLVKLGILTDNILTADAMSQNVRGSLSGSLNKLINPLSKAYNIPDNAVRYVIWHGYRNKLMDILPNIKGGVDEYDRIAAEMTLNTHTAYSRLSPVVQAAGKAGVATPFISFTADLSRSTNNYFWLNKRLAFGNIDSIRKEYRIEGGDFNVNRAKIEGVYRLMALGAVTVGAVAAVRYQNSKDGIEAEQADAISRSFLPEWDQGKQVRIKIDKEDPDKFTYSNPEYLVPHLAFASFFSDMISDFSSEGLTKTLQNTPTRMKSLVGGEGPPALTGLFEALSGEAIDGNPRPNRDQYLFDVMSNVKFVANRDYIPSFIRDTANYVLAHDTPLKEYGQEVFNLALSISPKGTRLSQLQVLSRFYGHRENIGSFSETMENEVNKMYQKHNRLVQDIGKKYQQSIGENPDNGPDGIARREALVNNWFNEYAKDFQVVAGQINMFLEDAKASKYFGDKELADALSGSGASNRFQYAIQRAWYSGKSFEGPYELGKGFVKDVVSGEIADLDSNAEMFAAIKSPMREARPQELISSAGTTVSRVRAMVTSKKQEKFTTREKLLANGGTQFAIDMLIQDGVKVGSQELNDLQKRGIISGKVVNAMIVAEKASKK